MTVIAKMTGALGMWVIAKPGTNFKSLADFKGKKVASLRYPIEHSDVANLCDEEVRRAWTPRPTACRIC
jgi:hypothetical protein